MTDSAKRAESETSNQICSAQLGSWDFVPSFYFLQGQGQPLRRTTNWADGASCSDQAGELISAMELENFWEITLTL